jgi:hypothetical protein
MTRRETAARLIPAPLAALALLLVVLILLTPVLFSYGPPAAGSLVTQAELIVDQVSGSNLTTFYVRALGNTIRYADMSIEVATDFNWTGSFPSGALDWQPGAQGKQVLTVLMNTTANPVALNVSAFYQIPGGSALFVGEIAFYFGGPPGSSGELLSMATATPNLALSGQYPVSGLPLGIVLVDVGAGP